MQRDAVVATVTLNSRGQHLLSNSSANEKSVVAVVAIHLSVAQGAACRDKVVVFAGVDGRSIRCTINTDGVIAAIGLEESGRDRTANIDGVGAIS